MRATRALFTIAIATLVTAGCGVTHIGQYKPKRRDYALDAESSKSPDPQSDGSLWLPGRPASMLFTDARALRVNDLVVIKVEEIADAKRSANTDLTRESDSSAQISAFLGLLSKIKAIDPSVGGSSAAHLKADGQSGRSEFLTATVPAMVRKVLPNGNLFVEGHRVVLVNAEEQHFYISGVVRPIDIDQENSVKSSMVADAEIEFVGSGVLTDNQHQGWFQRYFGWLWPF